jgi:hypothetical protein
MNFDEFEITPERKHLRFIEIKSADLLKAEKNGIFGRNYTAKHMKIIIERIYNGLIADRMIIPDIIYISFNRIPEYVFSNKIHPNNQYKKVIMRDKYKLLMINNGKCWEVTFLR